MESNIVSAILSFQEEIEKLTGESPTGILLTEKQRQQLLREMEGRMRYSQGPPTLIINIAGIEVLACTPDGIHRTRRALTELRGLLEAVVSPIVENETGSLE